MSARPDLDPELAALLAAMPEMPPLGPDTLAAIRPYATVPAETALAGRDVDRRDVTVTAPDGASIGLTILSPSRRDRDVPAPCVYWIHGGGMVMGDRFSQVDIPLDWLEQLGAVVVTVDYRLAPDVTGLTPVEDCYAGLAWVAANADELGIDPARLVVAGTSAGGGLAAGVTLLARDRSGPALAAQVLVCPMLDHRNGSVSSRQFDGPGIWSREANAFAWSALLGDTAAEAVSCYASPALADDLSGLPPTFLDAGSAEVFRDEVVTYAGRIWEAGGPAELHVWSGGCHGFDALFPEVRVSASARCTRTSWLERVLCPPSA